MQPNLRWLILSAVLPLFAMGATCGPTPSITITSPGHGSFSTAASVAVTGTIAGVNFTQNEVRVNGAVATLNTGTGSWSSSVALSATLGAVNPVNVEIRSTQNPSLIRARKRVVVITGQSVADGAFSLSGVGLRIADTGLNQLEPIITQGVAINPASLLPVGSTVISGYCAIPGPFGSCLGSITAKVANPPPSITGFALDADSMTNFVTGDVDVFNLRIDLDLDGSGLAPDCGLRLSADNTQILGDYTLSPDTDPTNVNVNQLGEPTVDFTGFEQEFTYGLCDFPLIGDLIQAIVGNVEPTVVTGFEDALDDPDGGGPLDAPVADAIETALANITIAGPIGDALQVNFEAPLFAVTEDNAGITLGSDARITSSIGTGTGQCQPPFGTPNLAASYHVPEAFPTFGATTPPPGNLPYGIAVTISTSAFNQLLKSQIECGLLRTSLTEVDFGFGLTPLTASTLAIFIPQLATFDPDQPMRIDLEPTLAPYLTGNPGPGGEIAELRIPQLEIEVHFQGFAGNGGLVIRGALDARAGLGLTFNDVTSELEFTVGSVTDLVIAFLVNNISTNETALASALAFILPDVLPALGDGLGAFPLPEFFGLSLDGVEVSRQGQFLTLFADLN